MTQSIESYQDDHLNREEEYRLIETVQNGTNEEDERTDEAQQALNQLIRSNIRLVIDRVRTETGRVKTDHLQQGFIGFIRAIERFETDSGYRLSSYATFWIKRKVHHYIYTKENPNRSVDVVKLDQRIKKARKELEQFQNNTTIESIANKLNKRPNRIRAVVLRSADSIRLDYQPDDHDWTLREQMGIKPNQQHRVLEQEVLELLEDGLNELDERTRRYMIDYYGLNGNDPLHYHEIGDKYGYTESRVAQIINKGYEQLRNWFQDHGYDSPLPDHPPRIVDDYT